MVQKGKPFSGPFRPRPVIEAFSRRANHQFTLVVLISDEETYEYFLVERKKYLKTILEVIKPWNINQN